MITDFFKATKKLGIGLALGSALAMGASSAFAGNESPRFYEKDFSSKSIKLAKWASGKVSNKIGGVTFLVYGGNEKLQGLALKVAKRMNSEGKPIGFIKAKDQDKLLQTMGIEFYTLGGFQYDIVTYDNDNISAEQTEQDIYEQATKAYEAEFGSEKITKKLPASDSPTLAKS